MRDRLIELIGDFPVLYSTLKQNCMPEAVERLADHLLAAGVVIPPCKVGDAVYKVYDIESVHRRVLELEVLLIEIGDGTRVCLKTTKKYLYNFDKASFDDFGKTVFLTREEAEKALERREG